MSSAALASAGEPAAAASGAAAVEVGSAEWVQLTHRPAVPDDEDPDGSVYGALLAKAPPPGGSRAPRLHHLVEHSVDRCPDACALECDGATLSYAQLDARANQLAHLLRARLATISLAPNATAQQPRVGLLCARGEWLYVSWLAILKSGAAYVPVDLAYPPDRVRFIAHDADLALMLAGSADMQSSHQLDALACPTLFLDAPATQAQLAEQPTTRPADGPAAADDAALAYVIYTSGTTGRPKGVAVPHRAVFAELRVVVPMYGVRPGDRVYQGLSVAFDFAVEEIVMGWAVGATLVASAAPATRMGDGLERLLRDARVTVLATVPTLLSTLDPARIEHLRIVALGGEVCAREVVDRWWRPGRRLLNSYGPTETTITSSMVELRPGEPVTIGRPLPGYTYYIVDEQLAPVAFGALGEIVIGGVGVTDGYLHRPDLTAAKFLPDPYVRAVLAPRWQPLLPTRAGPTGTPPRMYRSGDRGRFVANGCVEIHGRVDDQIKLRGYRFELQEVEAVLREHPAVRDAAVKTLPPGGTPEELAAYVILLSPPAAADEERVLTALRVELLQRLRARLPAFIVPATIDVLPAFPTLPSGKCDRRALPAPQGPRLGLLAATAAAAAAAAAQEQGQEQASSASPGGEAGADRPRGAWEERVAGVYATALALSGAHAVPAAADLFTALGGHSLTAAHIASALRSAAADGGGACCDVSIADIYAFPTVRALAAHLAATSASDPAGSGLSAATASAPLPETAPASPAPSTPSTPSSGLPVARASSATGLSMCMSSAMAALPPVAHHTRAFEAALLARSSATPPVTAAAASPPALSADKMAPVSASSTSAHVSPLRYWVCGVAQLALLFAYVALVTLPVAVLYVETSAGDVRVGTVALWVAVLLLAPGVLPVLLKWVLVGRLRAGRYPMWSWFYCRLWLARKTLSFSPLPILAGSPLFPYYARLLGMHVSTRAYVASAGFALPDLVTVEDGASIGHNAWLQPFVVEDGGTVLRLAPIVIARGASLGTNAVVLAGARVGADATVASQTLVPRDSTVAPGVHVRGSPPAVAERDPLLRDMEAAAAAAASGADRPSAVARGVHVLAYVAAAVLLYAFPLLVLAAGLALTILAYDYGGFVRAAVAIPVSGAATAVSAMLLVIAGRWVLLPRAPPPLFALSSGLALRKWVVDKLLELSLRLNYCLYATLYTLPYLRALGAKVGAWSEVSTVQHVEPPQLRLGAGVFVADMASLGATLYHRGFGANGGVEVGDRTFIGNSSVIGAHAKLPARCLIGVHSVPPSATAESPSPMAEGTSWIGSPPMFLPHRQVVTSFGDRLTFTPPAHLVAYRLLTELVRILLPPSLAFAAGLAVTCGMRVVQLADAVQNATRAQQLVTVWGALIAFGGAALGGTLAFVALLKWALIGRYRPRMAPLWAPFVRHTELVTGVYESAVSPVLAMLGGTPWLPCLLRALGVHCGRGVYLDQCDFTEFDLIHIADHAVVYGPSVLQTHLFEDRVMKLSHVHIGEGATVGVRCFVLYDTHVGARTELDAMSLVMKGESLPAAQFWRGIPARRVHAPALGLATCSPPPPPPPPPLACSRSTCTRAPSVPVTCTASERELEPMGSCVEFHIVVDAAAAAAAAANSPK